MDSLDGEEQRPFQLVSNFSLRNEKKELVCFSILPHLWSDGDDQGYIYERVFLCGSVGSKSCGILKEVVAWNVKLEGPHPKYYVLTKEQQWLCLSKPMAEYAHVCMNIMVTIRCLHYVRRKHDATYISLGDHLEEAFSYLETKPSVLDIQDHIQLIHQFFLKDSTLRKSQLLSELFYGTGEKKNVREELPNVEDLDFFDDEEKNVVQNADVDDGFEEEEDNFDPVCSICDDGDNVLCCEGPCSRSFHAYEDAVTMESHCETLGLTPVQVEEMEPFFCGNCSYKKHQCFSCGELGSSDKLNAPEVD